MVRDVSVLAAAAGTRELMETVAKMLRQGASSDSAFPANVFQEHLNQTSEIEALGTI